MSRLQIKEGKVTVTLDDDVERMVRDLVDRLAPGVRELVGDAARELHDQARDNWPVGPDRKDRPYHSRDRIQWTVLVDTKKSEIRGAVWCDAEWAKYIKPKGKGGKTAFVLYFRGPAGKLRVRLRKQMTDQVRAILAGGG